MADLDRCSLHLVMNHHDPSDVGVKVVGHSVLIDIPGVADVTLEFPLPVFEAWLAEIRQQVDSHLVAIAEADHARTAVVA